MLKGISPLISPELLKILAEMGHGDEIVLADAHFPVASLGKRVVRADGQEIAPLLHAIAQLMPLDTYPRCKADSSIDTLSVLTNLGQSMQDTPTEQLMPPALLMAPVAGDHLPPTIQNNYQDALRSASRDIPAGKLFACIARKDFYRLAAEAYAIVATSDTTQYANIILRKGVVWQ